MAGQAKPSRFGLARLRQIAEDAILSPRVTITMDGGDRNLRMYRSFVRGHRLVPFLAAKAHGVGLMAVPPAKQDYLAGPEKQAVRRKVSKARRSGYSVAPFDAMQELEAILAVNRSAEDRQGKEVRPDYLTLDGLAAYFRESTLTMGVRDSGGRLCGYIDVRASGEMALLSRILGDIRDQDAGIMYLLVAGTVQELQRSLPQCRWIMYDMFVNAQPGLRYFKQRLGFSPHRVRWIWKGVRAGGAPAP